MLNSKIKAGCLLAVALLCTSGAAVASIVVSESFNYANGNLAGNNGGVGWGGAWTNGGVVAAGVAGLTGNITGDRSLSAAIVPTAGQSLYLGLTLGADPSAPNGDFAGLTFLSQNADRLFFGMPFERNAYGFGVNGYATRTSSIAASTMPSYLVAQILFNAASNLTVNLYVDPLGSLGVADATYTGTFLAGNWDSIRIVNSNSRSTFDNIVIGTTLADVYPRENAVPEPSSFALAGFALAALMTVRHRRSKP